MSFTPDETRALADQAAQSIRLLNHATLPWDDYAGLHSPADAYDVIASLAHAASMLPQLLDQLSAYLTRQLEHDHVQIDGGEHVGDPLAAISAASFQMQGRARDAATVLSESLSVAQNSIAFARTADPAPAPAPPSAPTTARGIEPPTPSHFH
jgi:hypothetical protein